MILRYGFMVFIFFTALSHAQLFGNSRKTDEKLDSMQKQIDQLNAYNQANAPLINELRQLNEKFKQHRADTSVLIEDLRNENQLLKGEIAYLKRQIELFEDNQKNFFKDAEFRLNEMESSNKKTSEAPAKASPSKASNNSSAKNTAQNIYDQALTLYQKNKDYPQAIAQFEAFIEKNPKDALVPNAYYWMGESYYALGKYARAIKTFDVVTKQYPKSSKKCDAILMQAKGFEALKKENEAKLFYSEVVTLCPKTGAADKAQAKLNG